MSHFYSESCQNVTMTIWYFFRKNNYLARRQPKQGRGHTLKNYFTDCEVLPQRIERWKTKALKDENQKLDLSLLGLNMKNNSFSKLVKLERQGHKDNKMCFKKQPISYNSDCNKIWKAICSIKFSQDHKVINFDVILKGLL